MICVLSCNKYLKEFGDRVPYVNRVSIALLFPIPWLIEICWNSWCNCTSAICSPGVQFAMGAVDGILILVFETDQTFEWRSPSIDVVIKMYRIYTHLSQRRGHCSSI